MPFDIENDTHWRTDDIKKMLAAVVDQACNAKKHRKVRVIHGNVHGAYRINAAADSITIELPIEGPKSTPAMVQLAAAAYDTPVILPSTVGFLMNTLAYEIFKRDNGSLADPVTYARLQSATRDHNIPTWAPKGVVIRKYMDPAKDSTFRKYVSRVEQSILNAERRVENYSADLAKAKKGLTRAQRDLKAAQKRLRAAKERRGL